MAEREGRPSLSESPDGNRRGDPLINAYVDQILAVQTTPAEFVNFLKLLAQGEPVIENITREKYRDLGHLFQLVSQPTPYPELMAPEVRSEYEARRAHFREGLLAELKKEFNDILIASPPPGVSEQTYAIAVRAKQVATELTVALRAGLVLLDRMGSERLGALLGVALCDRSEEARLVSRGQNSESIVLAFTELETVCRGMNTDWETLGVKAVEGGLENSPHGGERIAKIGSAFFKALRNDILHAREEGRPALPDDLVMNCINYLIERGSSSGPHEVINNPIWHAWDALGSPQDVDDATARSLSYLNEPLYQKVAERVIDIKWAALNSETSSVPPIKSDPVTEFDREVKVAIEVLREEATEALQASGIDVKNGQDPLAVLRNKSAKRLFGDSPTRAEGWQEIVTILLQNERDYFSGDSGATNQAARAASLDKSINAEVLEMGLRDEAAFIISLCCLLSRTIKHSTPAPGKNPSEVLNTLEYTILSAFQEEAPSPTIPFFQYALAVERLFKDIATRTAPEWKQSWNKKVPLEQHARNVIFATDKTTAALSEMGVSPSDAPKIVRLVSGLFDTLRNRWAHDAKERPKRAEIAELLHCAALLSTLTDLTDGRYPRHASQCSHFEVRDVAQVASLHSIVFDRIAPAIAGKVSITEAADSLKRLISERAGASVVAEAVTSGDKFRQDAMRELSEGLLAIWDSALLPPIGTTEGLLSRAALVSALLRWTKEPSYHEPSFPLWQVHCKVVP